MNTVVMADGKVALPSELRQDAQLQPGDTLDVQLYKGTIVMRKRRPLTPAQCASLLERSRAQPRPGPDEDAAVEQSLRDARAQRR